MCDGDRIYSRQQMAKLFFLVAAVCFRHFVPLTAPMRQTYKDFVGRFVAPVDVAMM
jgi:hypothetical protein